MTVEEIRRALEESRGLGTRQRLDRLERLAEHARSCPDRVLEAEVLVALTRAHEYSAERARLPVVIGRLLQLLDAHPAELADFEQTVYWDLKWMTSAMIANPAVPVATVLRWMEEMDRRYRERGISLRPVHALRGRLAVDAGEMAAGEGHMEAAIAAVRDEMADCHACESNALGYWRLQAGDDPGALRYWAPVLEGEQTCAQEPHVVLANALLPLLREGRSDEARAAHLKGYPMVRRTDSLRRSVGRHIEFCALTGNEGRGLEILAEHAEWLSAGGEDVAARLGFLEGALVLLRRLAVLGLTDLPLGEGTVGSVLAAAEPEARELAARYDARTGSPHRSGLLAVRLGREPLLERLPLGTRGRLIPAPRLAEPESAVPEPAVPEPAVPEPAVPEPAAKDAFDALLAEARRLSALRHPGADAAWRRAAALPAPTPELALELRLYAARALEGPEPETVARELAALLPDLADLPTLRLEALAARAVALIRCGGTAAGGAVAREAAEEADRAWHGGALTAAQHLAARRAVPFAAMAALDGQGTDAARQAAEIAEAELALAVKLGVAPRAAQYAELAGRIRAGLGETAAAELHLAAAREGYLETGQHWFLPAPAHFLAGLALESGDAARAEELVSEALRLGPPVLGPEDLGPLASFLVEILTGQDGRDADVVDAALEAARLWEGVHEPDHVHNVCNAARAYLVLGRNGEAVGLFEQVADRFEASYEGGPLAVTRRQYGWALRETGDGRRAAEQFLAGAAVAAGLADAERLEADLAWYAAEELGSEGMAEESVAAYRRSAALWEGLGEVDSQVRCLRAAAWAEYGLDSGPDRSEPDGRGPAAMRAVLAAVEERAAAEPSPELAELLAGPREQLGAMLRRPGPEAGS